MRSSRPRSQGKIALYCPVLAASLAMAGAQAKRMGHAAGANPLQRSLQMVGAISVRPPAWVAFGLRVLLGLAVLLAGLGLIAALAIGPAELATTLHRQLLPPWSLDAGGIRLGAAGRFPGAGPVTVVTYSHPAAARDAFVAAQAQLPPGAGAALF